MPQALVSLWDSDKTNVQGDAMETFRKYFRRHIYILSVLLLFTVVASVFQNCAPAKFGSPETADFSSMSSSLSAHAFVTNEDTPLEAQPKTFAMANSSRSYFTVTRQPSHGQLTSFDSTSGKFTYMPGPKFFGEDSFQYIEQEEGVATPHEVPISIEVIMVTHLAIKTELIGFEMDSPATEFLLDVYDYNDPKPLSYLSFDLAVLEVKTKYGLLKKLPAANRFSYKPDAHFRGNDQYEFVAKNSFGETTKKVITLNVGNPFRNLEPSMAVRASGCISCHLNASSKVITDFGYGNNFFFGKHGGANPLGAPYSWYSDNIGGGWFSTTLKEIIVPNVALPFRVGDYAATYSSTSSRWSASQKNATTVPEYMRAVLSSNIEKTRPAATVTTKSEIYIGAPTAEILISRSGIESKPFVYFKNTQASPELSGLVKKNTYYEAQTLTCDGDLTINGTVFLKNLTLITNNGCRIYATGPIFVNGKINYIQAVPGATNNTNLQLVSSRWINLGVGQTHCEKAANYPKNVRRWYYELGNGTNENPMAHRVVAYAAPTRSGKEDGTALQAIAKTIVDLQDASCRPVITGQPAPREVHFERLLLNAPRVDSRYTGQFTGVIISELALMSLADFTFQFDDVFKRVPILPQLLPSHYLVVKP